MHADDLALALRLADAADAVTLPRFRAADLRVTTKPDRSPVTDADTAAEEALRALIAAERPADAVLGEEGGGEVTDVGRLWVLDPIDGTKNFSRGMPAWATLDRVDGRRRGDGRRRERARAGSAVVGRGRGGRVDVGRAGRGGRGGSRSPGSSSLGDAYLSTTDLREFRRGAGTGGSRLCDAVWETRAFGDFWQHVLVAEGVLDVAVDPVANPWDLAALAPVVAEAGGRLTDLAGVDTWAGGDALTTNGALHDAARAVIGR